MVLCSSCPAPPWPSLQRRPANKDSDFRAPKLVQLFSSVMPSGTESLNFTRDTQRCCQPWQLTPASPADSPSVHAPLRMLRCSQVTVPQAQEETEVTHPPVPARGKQKPKYKSVSFQQDHYHTHNRPFKPPHLYAVLAFNLMCQRTQNILQFSS